MVKVTRKACCAFPVIQELSCYFPVLSTRWLSIKGQDNDAALKNILNFASVCVYYMLQFNTTGDTYKDHCNHLYNSKWLLKMWYISNFTTQKNTM